MEKDDLLYGECIHNRNMASCDECNSRPPIILIETNKSAEEMLFELLKKQQYVLPKWGRDDVVKIMHEFSAQENQSNLKRIESLERLFRELLKEDDGKFGFHPFVADKFKTKINNILTNPQP